MSEQEQTEVTEASKGIWSSMESKISLIALILSVVAVLTSIIEVNFIRQELRSEAWPYISLDTRYNADGFALTITNKGVGPARLRSVELLYEGKVINDIDKLILDTVGKENAFSYNLYGIRNPAPGVMSAGEQVELFTVPWEPRSRLFMNNLSGDLSVRACYCSIYDECWRAGLTLDDPVPVERCD